MKPPPMVNPPFGQLLLEWVRWHGPTEKNPKSLREDNEQSMRDWPDSGKAMLSGVVARQQEFL